MPVSRLADRINAARRQMFVGRSEERELFLSALTGADQSFAVLYIHGPGGVGKSTLLQEFQHICDQHSISCLLLDGRRIEPSPSAFLNAIASSEFFDESLQKRVLIIDTFETLTPLEVWIREEFLLNLPEDVLVVIAGRSPLSAQWRSDSGWQSLMKIVALRNLRPDESKEFLDKRNVPGELFDSVLEFTHGHPLALSLIADTYAQRGTLQLQTDDKIDIITTLTEQFVQRVPGPAHRSALEACAMVRMLTESLLATMLSSADVRELFDWLRGLSFIESSEGGLYPHDLARETLTADIRWRNPDWYATLHKRAREFYAARLQQSQGNSQQENLVDYIYLHRDNPAIRPFFEWKQTANYFTDSASIEDIHVLADVVHTNEGPESQSMLEFWLERQLHNTQVIRNSSGLIEGFLVMINLSEATPQDITTDPATRSVQRYLESHAPLRSGERATLFRFWMSTITYQDISPVQSLVFVNAVLHYLTTPGLAFTFFPCFNPEMWAMMFAYGDLARLPEADYRCDDRSYGVYGHDWRITPPSAWLALLAERELTMTSIHQASPPVKPQEIIVLSRPDFELAVRNALKYLNDEQQLRHNPLVNSRMILDTVGNEADVLLRSKTLSSILNEVILHLETTTKGEKLYRVIHRTFVKPASTQERAAELLDLPFSTYRRHLTAGIEKITELLWQMELGRQNG